MSFISAGGRRWGDVAITAFAQFFGALGTFLVAVTLILALQQRGATGMEVSVLVICEALPMVVLGKLIGAVVDRFDSRTLLVLSGIGQVVACLALSQADSFPAVLTGAVALAVASGVAIPTRQALLPAMVNRDDLPRVMAIGQTAGSAGMMIGPALAGFMVGGVGVERTVEIAAALFLVTIVAGLTVRTRRGGRAAAVAPTSPVVVPGQRPEPGSGQRPEPVAGWQLRDDRLLWSSAWGLTASMLAMSAVNVVLVFFIMRTLHGTEQEFGLVDSMWTVGMLAGVWICGRMVRPGTTDLALTRGVFTVLGVMSAALLVAGSVRAAVWIVPCYLIGGMQNGGLNVLVGTILGRRVPAAARGRASTALAMRVQTGGVVGYLAGGLLLELAEPRWIVIGCGALGVLTAFGAIPLISRAMRTSSPVDHLTEVAPQRS